MSFTVGSGRTKNTMYKRYGLHRMAKMSTVLVIGFFFPVGILLLGGALLLALSDTKGPSLNLTHDTEVLTAQFSPDGQFVATTSTQQPCDLLIWNARNGDRVNHFSGCPDGKPLPIYSISYSPDGRQILVMRGDETVWLLDAKTGKYIRQFIGHTETVLGASFSPDGRYAVTYSADKTARTWNIQTGQEILLLTGHQHWVGDAVFSPDGLYIATMSDGIRLWDATTGDELRHIKASSLTDIEFSRDGKTLLSSGNDSLVRVWDVTTGNEIERFDWSGKWINSVFFDPSGKRIIAVGQYAEVRIWDTNTRQVIRDFAPAPGSNPVAAALSPDGKSLIMAYDNQAQAWSLDQ
jgi:WD40 repeat protein